MSIKCKEEIEGLKKMGEKINGIAVVNEYVKEYFENMGCQKHLEELLIFIKDFYSDQIHKQFREICKKLTSKYQAIKHE